MKCVFGAALAVVLGATAADAASFNCNRKLSKTEAAICNNAGLSSMDSQLASEYSRLVGSLSGSQRATLIGSQKAWIRERNGCGADAGCLAVLYRERMGFLQSYGQ